MTCSRTSPMMRLRKIEPAQIADAMRTVRAGSAAGTRTSSDLMIGTQQHPDPLVGVGILSEAAIERRRRDLGRPPQISLQLAISGPLFGSYPMPNLGMPTIHWGRQQDR